MTYISNGKIECGKIGVKMAGEQLCTYFYISPYEDYMPYIQAIYDAAEELGLKPLEVHYAGGDFVNSLSDIVSSPEEMKQRIRNKREAELSQQRSRSM